MKRSEKPLQIESGNAKLYGKRIVELVVKPVFFFVIMYCVILTVFSFSVCCLTIWCAPVGQVNESTTIGRKQQKNI